MQVIANNFRGVRNGDSYKIEVQADAGSLTAIYKEDKKAGRQRIGDERPQDYT